MAARTFISKLPDQVKAEINARLRAAQYSGQVEISRWLTAQGYNASKSSVNRYAQALKDADGMDGLSGHAIAAAVPIQSGLTVEQNLLLQLGELKLRESQLIEQLLELRTNREQSR
jgi:hypothetical protein